MARAITLTCDWCRETAYIAEDEEPLENGWIMVTKWDNVKDEPMELDYCSDECASVGLG